MSKKNKIIGWTLLNSTVYNEHFFFMRNKIDLFKSEGLLDTSRSYVIGQKFIEPKYRGLGLVQLSTDILESKNANKYDSYIASVKRDNITSYKFVTKQDYRLIIEEKDRFFFQKAFFKTKRPINSISVGYSPNNLRFDIRFAEEGDIPELITLNTDWNFMNVVDKSSGFLTSIYSGEDFHRMILAGELNVICSLCNELE